MERLETKTSWSSPELIVLVRGKPEEAILGGCKNTLTAGGQEAVWSGQCTYNDGEGCTGCVGISNS
jgi:hypothetical protein